MCVSCRGHGVSSQQENTDSDTWVMVGLLCLQLGNNNKAQDALHMQMEGKGAVCVKESH